MNETHRDAVMKLVQASHPQATFEGDEQMFAAIIDDYVEYAKLLEAETAATQLAQEREAARESSLAALRENPEIRENEIEPLVAMLDEITANVVEGNFTADDVTNALHALRYEADMAAAEVRGRNATIEESLLTPEPTDGLPHLNGSDAYLPSNPYSLFAIASQA